MSGSAASSVKLDALKVPADAQRGVGEFIDEVLTLYGDSLQSIFAFGSAVSGDFEPGESDINLIVVHASLDIEDLDKVSALSRRWLRQQMLAPRFLSRRNFDDFVRHFQVDLLAIRGAAAILWGQDLLRDVPMRPNELRWQATHEIKTMRLRIKQQFWRLAGDEKALQRVLLDRFQSLSHLMRAALALRGLEAPARRSDVLDAAVAHLGIDATFVKAVTALRPQRSAERDALVALFGQLLDAIRVVDAAIGDHQE